MNDKSYHPRDDLIEKVQICRYMLEKLGPCDYLKLIKLVVLADVYKLRKYGETISGDRYVALKNGPVPSTLANIVGFVAEYVDRDDLTYAEKFIKTTNKNVEPVSDLEVDFDYLAKTDIECIDFVIKNYGHRDSDYLINDSKEGVHEFSAWYKHKIKEFGQGNCADMNLEDFFENDGPVQVSNEILENSKKNYHTYSNGY